MISSKWSLINFCCSCGLVTKHHERIQKFREAGDLNHIYKNEFNKAYFAHDAAYFNSKALRELFQIGFWQAELMKLL